jgi:subtilase family serine protease
MAWESNDATTTGTTPTGLVPADLQSAYNLPSGRAGAGQLIAIVDAYDNPNAEADMNVYRAQFGLGPCTTANGCFRKVNQDGQEGPYPAESDSWAVEISLDLDMASAICPLCKIVLVESTSHGVPSMLAAVKTAASFHPAAISNSWGTKEYPHEAEDEQAFFNHLGIMITAAAGDHDYGMWFPAASQFVTAVGGTALTKDPTTARGWTEVAFGTPAKSGIGTGSGCSTFIPKPSWQKDTGCPNRTVADVSAVSACSSRVAIYDSIAEWKQQGWRSVCGTSVATPIIAAAYALAGNSASLNYASSLYSHSAHLNDVTSGSNGLCGTYLCNSGPGYDGPTGMGTPDGLGAF